MWRQNLQACNRRCLKFHLKGNNITQNNDNSLEGIKCMDWNCNLEEPRDSLQKDNGLPFSDSLNNPTHFMWDKLPATEGPYFWRGNSHRSGSEYQLGRSQGMNGFSCKFMVGRGDRLSNGRGNILILWEGDAEAERVSSCIVTVIITILWRNPKLISHPETAETLQWLEYVLCIQKGLWILGVASFKTMGAQTILLTQHNRLSMAASMSHDLPARVTCL